MKRILAGLAVATVMVALMGVAMAEEAAINPIRVTTRQINAYGPNPIQIMGTNVTATAAELNILDGCTATYATINAAADGTTATITPTTATVGTLLTISKKLVQTPETITLTKGAFTLTPTNSLYLFNGQYGVATVTVASATSPGMPLQLINIGATNVVVVDGTANITTFPAGYTEWTNGQYDVMNYRSVSTNWICTGTFAGE